MTPEERATQIAEGLGSFAAPIVKGWLVSEIEKAIRAAVEAERDRCAQVAEEMSKIERRFQIEASEAGDYERASECGAAADIADGIAKAIRNTNAPPEAEQRG